MCVGDRRRHRPGHLRCGVRGRIGGDEHGGEGGGGMKRGEEDEAGRAGGAAQGALTAGQPAPTAKRVVLPNSTQGLATALR